MRRGHDGGDVPDRRRPEVEGRACSRASRYRVPAGSARPRRAEDSSVLAGSRRPDSSASRQATRRQDRFANGLSAQQRDCPAVQPASRRTDRPPRRSASRPSSQCLRAADSVGYDKLAQYRASSYTSRRKKRGLPWIAFVVLAVAAVAAVIGLSGVLAPSGSAPSSSQDPESLLSAGSDSVAERKTADDVVMTL